MGELSLRRMSIDTSDATATAAEILLGFSAYAKGKKLAGALRAIKLGTPTFSCTENSTNMTPYALNIMKSSVGKGYLTSIPPSDKLYLMLLSDGTFGFAGIAKYSPNTEELVFAIANLNGTNSSTHLAYFTYWPINLN